MKNFLNKGGLAVPTADATANAYLMDVPGNKTDAAATGPVSTTESLMAYTKQNVTEGIARDAAIAVVDGNVDTLLTTSAQIVATASVALPQTSTLALFTVTGVVRILEIRGFIGTQIGAVANATKLQAGGGSVDICATVDLNAAAANSILAITGVFANAMAIKAGGAWEAQTNEVGVGAGSISVNCAGSDGGTGRVLWVVVYKPVSAGSSIVAA